MTQELIDLRVSILEGRYDDALAIVNELEEMSKQAIIRNIESFLTRMLIHLLKNQMEQRVTNSWAASIGDSILAIKKLNLKDNKTSYYIHSDEWISYLEDALEAAIRPASVEIFGGRYNPFQLSELLNRDSVIAIAQELLALTYTHSVRTVPAAVDEYLTQLPGGEAWRLGEG